MANGRLEIFDQSGSVQFDTENASLHMTQSGSTTITSSGHPFGPVSVSITANSPIVAWGASSGPQMCNVYNSSGWEFQPYGVLGGYGEAFNYYVFDNGAIPSIPSGQAGFEIFDASSNLLYSSLAKPLRIIGVVSGTAASIVGTHTFPSGPTYAATITQQPQLLNSGGYPATDCIMVQPTSTGFVIAREQGNNAGATFTPSDYSQVVFLDVSNY